MLKKFFLLSLAALSFCGCTVSSRPSPPPKPAAVAPAPAPVQPKAAKKFQLPALENQDSWMMVVVPDVQTYIKQIENHGILDMMLAWIVRRRAELNIQQVLFTGDLVYRNDTGTVVTMKKTRFYRSGRLNDLVSEEQWKAFSRLMERLDGEVPYILCTGNHDYGTYSAEERKTYFDQYFPTDRNKLTRRHLVECAPNVFGKRTLENSAYEFTAPKPDGRKFLIITLQFAPTDADLKWALKVADDPRFADHIGIVLTHSYILASGQRIEKENYAVNRAGGNPGEAIFRKLIYPAKNIRLVICGHIAVPDQWDKGIAFSMDKNSSGKSVAQMAFNTQAIGGGWHGSGGDGWLRLLEFLPDRKTVRARTFSPLFAISPSTRHLAWKHDKLSEFTFEISAD